MVNTNCINEAGFHVNLELESLKTPTRLPSQCQCPGGQAQTRLPSQCKCACGQALTARLLVLGNYFSNPPDKACPRACSNLEQLLLLTGKNDSGSFTVLLQNMLNRFCQHKFKWNMKSLLPRFFGVFMTFVFFGHPRPWSVAAIFQYRINQQLRLFIPLV